MNSRKVIILVCALLAMPFSVAFADAESDTLHNNTYQDSAQVACTTSTLSACSIAFKPTQHKTTVITNINCNFIVPSTTQILVVRLYDSNNSDVTISTPYSYFGSSGGYAYFGINAQINFFIGQGGVPTFYLITANGDAILPACTISGYHS